MRTPRFIEDMSIQHRVAFTLKCTFFVIAASAAMIGHPPSRGQTVAITAEDAREDADISHNEESIRQQTTALAAANLVAVQQGQDIARLDTKISILFGILATLQGGTFVVERVSKKRA